MDHIVDGNKMVCEELNGNLRGRTYGIRYIA